MKISITIGIRDGKVAVIENATRVGLALSWRLADEFATAISYRARGLRDGSEHVNSAEISLQENEVHVLIHGRLVFCFPLPVAQEVANAIKGHARHLEELELAESIAFDHAILQRHGLNIGLTSNPDIQELAGNEAAWNTELRRAIPSSANLRQYHIGTPSVKKKKGGTPNEIIIG